MIIIIAGAVESDRNAVCGLLAETLGWEFVDAENLVPQGKVDARRQSSSPAHADRTGCTETLSAAINVWIYEWRDIVLSTPELTEEERRQLSRMSSLVRVVCLDDFHGSDRTCVSERCSGDAISRLPGGPHAARKPDQSVFRSDLSQPVEAIIAELTAVLIK